MADARNKFIDDWMDRALSHEDHNEWKKAEECYEQIIKMNPTFADAWIGLGHTLNMQKKYSDAIDAYKKVLETNKDHVTALTGLAGSYFLEDNIEEAIKYYKLAASLTEDNAEIYFALGKVYQSSGHIDQAIEAYETGLKKHLGAKEIWVTLGELFEKQEKIESAIKAYEGAMRADRKDDIPVTKLGHAHLKNNDLDNAENAFKRAIEINAVNTDAKEALDRITQIKWDRLPEEEKKRIKKEEEDERQKRINKIREQVAQKSTEDEYSCPNCGKMIESHWQTCPFCKNLLKRNTCPKCGSRVNTSWLQCPMCGTDLSTEHGEHKADLPSLKKRENVMPTGIADMDTLLGGGIPKHSVIFLISDTETKHGAELFLFQFMQKHIEKGSPVVYIGDKQEYIQNMCTKHNFTLDPNYFHFVDIHKWVSTISSRKAEKIGEVFGLSDSDMILKEGKFYLNQALAKHSPDKSGLIVCDFVPFLYVEIDKKEIEKMIITMSSKLKQRYSVLVPADLNFMDVLSPIKTVSNVILRFREKEVQDRLISQFSALVDEESLKKWVSYQVKENSLHFF